MAEGNASIPPHKAVLAAPQEIPAHLFTGTEVSSTSTPVLNALSQVYQEGPVCLFTGAGASVSSGTSLNRAVVERVVGEYDLNAFDEFPEPINHALETYLNRRDSIVVGHGMRDTDINRCLKDTGSSIWYVGPAPPSGEIAQLMKQRKSEHNIVSGDLGYFDPFFAPLRAELLGGTAEVGVDQIAQSIFSFAREDGLLIGSGFLLEDTGLVVTGSSILAGLGQGSAPGVKGKVRCFTGGPQRQAELVLAPETVLDYAVFKVPDVIESSPLQLADDLPNVGEPVTACISVGETQGFHDGAVTGVNRSVPIGMGGGRTETITNLIETDIKAKPGSCGSPLVRKDGRVVGVIVAGNGRSYALTALRLQEMLTEAKFL